MAILNHTDFSGSDATYSIPASDSSTLYTGSIDIMLSTGVTTQVFDALSTAIKCIHYMEVNSLYSLSPNEDITILN